MDTSKKIFVATGILVFDFELFIGDLQLLQILVSQTQKIRSVFLIFAFLCCVAEQPIAGREQGF